MIRRLERQDLVALGEQRLDVGEWRSRTRADHHFRRLVENDAVEPAHGNGVGCLRGAAETRARAAAFDGERRLFRARVGDDGAEVGFGGGLVGHLGLFSLSPPAGRGSG